MNSIPHRNVTAFYKESAISITFSCRNRTSRSLTLRLFNPQTKLWSIYWADSNTGVLDKPVVGSFSNKVGHFYSRGMVQPTVCALAF